MKLIVKAHIVTAIAGWVLIIIMTGPLIIEEGGLFGIASLCMIGVVTGITVVDLLSVYLVRKGTKSILPFLSAGFWGLIFTLYGAGIFFPDQPWQSRIVFAALAAIAAFKVTSVVSLLRSE